MSDSPETGAPGGTSDGLDDAAAVRGALDRAGAAGGAAVRLASLTIAIVCALAAATGLTALALALVAWGGTLAADAVLVAATLPAVGLPAYVAIRTRPLADALRHPNEALDQAKDLIARAQGSPELKRLAQSVRSGRNRRSSTVGSTRRLLRSGRAISAVIGLAQPDPKRHRLLIPFSPERLGRVWLAVTVGLWWWLFAAAMAAAALIEIGIRNA